MEDWHRLTELQAKGCHHRVDRLDHGDPHLADHRRDPGDATERPTQGSLPHVAVGTGGNVG